MIAHGPWSDSTAITDPDLLAELAEDPHRALGVLCNTNLTGAALARSAERAVLNADAVTGLYEGRLIMEGRTAADQVAICKAALGRSQAAALKLVPHLNPEAALLLYREASTTRFKGATPLRHEIRRTVNTRAWNHATYQRGYLDAVAEICAEDTDLTVAVRIAAAYGDPEALIAFSPLLAGHAPLPRGRDTDLLHMLLLCTTGHPEVVTHWARHGGVLGAQVAAIDYRQDLAVLTELAHTWLDVEDDYDIGELLLSNHGAPMQDRVAWLTPQMQACFTLTDAERANLDGDPATAAMQSKFERFSRQVVDMLEASTEFDEWPFTAPSTVVGLPLDVLDEHLNRHTDLPPLACWEAALALELNEQNLDWIAGALGALGALPHLPEQVFVLADAVDEFDLAHDDIDAQFEYGPLAIHQPRRFPPRPLTRQHRDDNPDGSISTYNTAVTCHEQFRMRTMVPHKVHSMLRTPKQWDAFLSRCATAAETARRRHGYTWGQARGLPTQYQIACEVIEAIGDTRRAKPDEFTALLGSGLGDL